MSGSEEQYRTASRFRDNYVDPALNNATYLGLQNQGFQNQSDNIAKMGDLNAKAEETVPGAIVNAFKSYQGGVDRSRKQAEQDQIMAQRQGQITQTDLTNQGIPKLNEGYDINNANNRALGTGYGLENDYRQMRNSEEQKTQNMKDAVGASGQSGRQTSYNASVANDALQPALTKSGISANYAGITNNASRLKFEQDEAKRANESSDFENAIAGIRMNPKLSPEQKDQAMQQLTQSGQFSHLPSSTLPGRTYLAESKANQGLAANKTATEIATTNTPAYHDLRQALDPVAEKLSVIDEMKAELARYQAHSRAVGIAPGLENTDANTARANIAALSEKITRGSGARIMESSPFTGVETRLQAAINDAKAKAKADFAGARIPSDMRNRDEVTQVLKKLQDLDKDDATGTDIPKLKLDAGNGPSMVDRVNAPPPQNQPRVVGNVFNPAEIGTPLAPPTAVGRR